MAQTLAGGLAQNGKASPRGLQVVFAFLVLLSGFCGISYEVLYARILGNFIGDQFAVSASILLTFMLGIGCGTLYAHRFWRFLWLIEGGIGLCGAALALGSGRIEELYYSTGVFAGGLRSSMLVCFLLLGVPAFLIGCSLPLFADYLSRIHPGGVFARTYMVYNFGAGLTVLVIEFILLRQLGIRNTVLAMAALNGVISVWLLTGFRRLRARDNPRPESYPSARHEMAALGMASVGSAVFQLLMIKLAECFLGPFREAFALVLALTLFGIATGSALVRWWRLDFRWLLLIGLGGLAWLMAGYEWVTRWYAALKPAAIEHQLTAVLLRAGALALLMGVPSIAFGATIPGLLLRVGNMARDSGRLLFISSIGNALGFLLMALVLHQHLDYGVLIVVVAALAGLSLLIYQRFRGYPIWVMLALLGTVLTLHRTRWNEDLLYLSYDAFESADLLEVYKAALKTHQTFKGAQDVFSLNRMNDEVHFFINGYVSMNLESTSERLVGAVPALLAPRTDKALVLGVGSGITAGTTALLFDRVDAVELSPVVLQNVYRMKDYNFDVVSQSHVRFVLDDGIHFTKVCREKYPLIINTVTSPRYFSSSKLYTRDFLETVRRCMTPDGLYVTWVDLRVGQRGLDIILKTVLGTFPQCWVSGVSSGYYLLICSMEPIQLRHPNLVLNHPALASYFRTNGLSPEWLPYGMLSTHAGGLITDRDVPINTLDYPALEFQMAWLDERPSEDFALSIEKQMSLTEIAEAMKPMASFDAVDLVIYSERLFEESRITKRRRELAAEEVEDFFPTYLARKLDFYARFSAEAKTAEAHHLYGSTLLMARRYEEAIEQANQALALDPSFDDARLNLGKAFESLGQLQPALTNYARELEVDPVDAEALYRIGRIHFKLKEYRQALEYLQKAKELAPGPSVDYYHAEALRQLNAPNRSEASDKADQSP